MNGFEQIKAFYSWVFNNPDKVRPTHISLYLFLWNQANRAMWVEWFKCPYDLAMQGACIGNKGTYYKCLDELQKWNLIEYKKGINLSKAPMIKLIKLYDTEPLSGQVTVPLSGQVTVPLSEPQGGPQHEPLRVLLHGKIYKLITDNIQLISNNLEKWIENENLKEKPKERIEFENFRKSEIEYLRQDIFEKLKKYELTKPIIYAGKKIPVVYYDLIEFVIDCLDDNDWKMNLKNRFGNSRFEDALSDFIKKLKTDNDFMDYEDTNDFKRHFSNWLAKNNAKYL